MLFGNVMISNVICYVNLKLILNLKCLNYIVNRAALGKLGRNFELKLPEQNRNILEPWYSG